MTYSDVQCALPWGMDEPLTPVAGLDMGRVRAIVQGAERLTVQEASQWYHLAPLFELGRWADLVCRRLHGPKVRTYVIDRNINYTNICTAHCTFCAFRRDAAEDDAYTLSVEAILKKIGELRAIGGTQILMQGGMNPELPIEWYEELLCAIRQTFPNIHIHAFSPPEFIEFVRFFQPPGATLEEKLTWVFRRLKAAGLDSLPGGGGEIFAQPVRRKIGLGKCSADEWLTVMHVAHKLGMYTSATMMFGHIEGVRDRLHHMDQIRTWQDQAIQDFGRSGGGRYKAFISWPFQRENTSLGRLPEWDRESGRPFPGDAAADGAAAENFGKVVRMAGAAEYLRIQALSRLYLDNIYSIGASWVTMGPHIGQVALSFGANDMGSVMMEENVVSAAGTTYCLTEELICRLIRNAGFLPAQRDNVYNLLRIHAGPDSPDLKVSDWSTQRARKLMVQTQHSGAESEQVVPISISISHTPSTKSNPV